MNPARLAVYGGTFDPPHVGHLAAAAHLRWALRVDEVRLVMANDPWQKRERLVTPAAQRFELVRAAVEGHEGLAASDVEIRRGGASFTIDTVEALRVEQPEAEILVVVGADAASGLDGWHRADELAAAATIVVTNRGSARTPELSPRWGVERCAVPDLDVSSTELRRRVAAGEPIDFLVPDAVRSRITDWGLYRGGR